MATAIPDPIENRGFRVLAIPVAARGRWVDGGAISPTGEGRRLFARRKAPESFQVREDLRARCRPVWIVETRCDRGRFVEHPSSH
jgi:hypothetical protein